MPRWRRTTACERATQWISLELDGEIAGLERAALARHLQRCEQCRSARTEIGGFTRRLREAPAHGPAWPVVVTALRRRKRVARVGLAALVAAIAVAGGVGSIVTTSSTPRAAQVEFVDLEQQRAFGEQHVSMEPVLFLVATPPPGSFGSRALL
jgi:ferric-dicitrate binding protein FerR (iron transport regulator)